jgi:hypothetical protein
MFLGAGRRDLNTHFLPIHRIGEFVIRDNRDPVGILTFNFLANIFLIIITMIKNNNGPEPGFEPGTEDPQSHMLPGYTIRAISSIRQYYTIYSTFPNNMGISCLTL